MSRRTPNDPTIGRASYKKPKRMADAELAALFNRKNNARNPIKAQAEKAKDAAVEHVELPTGSKQPIARKVGV